MKRLKLRNTESYVRRLLCFVLTIGLAVSSPASIDVGAADLILETSGSRFTVNGQQKFLVFVSYFDALDQSSTNRWNDFEYLRAEGVDGIRIFPNWWGLTSPYTANSQYHFAQDTLVKDDGTLRSTRITKFLQVLDDAKAKQLVVDVVFSAETVKSCSSTCYAPLNGVAGTLTKAELKNALKEVTLLLANAGSKYKHVMFDIQNETNSGNAGPSDRPITESDALAMKQAIHAIDPYRVVTISFTSAAGGTSAANFADAADLDASNMHGRRTMGFQNLTGGDVDAMRLASPLPAYISEITHQLRTQDGWSVDNIRADMKAVKENGGAAWCFHTTKGHFLNSNNSLQFVMTTEEKNFVENFKAFIDAVSWGN